MRAVVKVVASAVVLVAASAVSADVSVAAPSSGPAGVLAADGRQVGWASTLSDAIRISPLSVPAQERAADKLARSIASDFTTVVSSLQQDGTIDTSADEQWRNDFWLLADLVVDLENSWTKTGNTFPAGSSGAGKLAAAERLVNSTVGQACDQKILSGPPCAP